MKLLIASAMIGLATSAYAAQSHFFKDVTVQPSDTLEGDLSLYRGNLVVQGEIRGNVAVIFGSCQLDSAAHITGNLVVVQGGLVLRDPAQVDGRISQRDFLQAATSDAGSPFSLPAVAVGASQDRDSEQTTKGPKRNWESEETDLFLVFNRAAGLQVGLEFPTGRGPIGFSDYFDVNGYACWAFGSKQPEWRLKLRRKLLGSGRLYVAGGLHRLTDTQDGWMLSTVENSLAGMLLKQDYRDYYSNRGYQLEAGGFLLKDLLHVNLAAFREQYGPAEVSTQWNWSGNDSPYRDNLYSDATGYQENRNQGLRAALDLRLWRDAEELEDHAWAKGGGLTLAWEKGLDSGGYDWSYERLLANLRFASPIGTKRIEHISGRLLAGSLAGGAPAQYLFRLGGPDAMPGFRPKSIDLVGSDTSADRRFTGLAGGTSMLLFSLENRFAGESLGFWPLSSFDLLLMTDIGQVIDGGIGDMEMDEFRSDVGVGIADEDDDFKLALFRATDTGEADWRLLCRLQRRF